MPELSEVFCFLENLYIFKIRWHSGKVSPYALCCCTVHEFYGMQEVEILCTGGEVK